MISSTSPTLSFSPFQRVGSNRSKPASEFVGHFCTAHPPSVRRTRNDDEFYGGFRRSTSLRRSQRSGVPDGSPLLRQDQLGTGHRTAIPGRAERAWPKHHQPTQPHLGLSQGENNNYSRGGKPGYLQDTLTSIRRSRERAQVSPQQQQQQQQQQQHRGSLSRTPSLRGSQQRGMKPTSANNNNNNNSNSRVIQPNVCYENEMKASRPMSMYTVPPQQQQQQHWRDTNYQNRSQQQPVQPVQPVSSSNDFYRIYRPSNGNIVCSTIGRSPAGSGGSAVDSFFQRTGSFHGGGYQTISGGSSMSAASAKNSNPFLRSFSFRKREMDDNNLTSSMPCLNDNKSGGSDGQTTPRAANQQYHRGGLDRTPSFRSGGTQYYNSSSGTMTPASSSLVINSLAYQILPSPRIPPPPPPASAPVTSGYPFIYSNNNGQSRKQGSAGSGGQSAMLTSISASR